MIIIKRGWIYLADLNPHQGTEPGKTRPVLVVQTDLLNNFHPSTIILPITTNIERSAKYLRVHLSKSHAGLEKDSDILIDQIRAIDNRRFIRALGKIPEKSFDSVVNNLAMIMDIHPNPR